jgi:hypothetical protein
MCAIALSTQSGKVNKKAEVTTRSIYQKETYKRNSCLPTILQGSFHLVLSIVGRGVLTALLLNSGLIPRVLAQSDPAPSKVGEVGFNNPHSTAYVDKEAKALLDGIAYSLRQNLDNTAVLVGFALKNEQHSEGAMCIARQEISN